ncbi:MAG: EamA family transporter [Candidatus Eisenbacteria bacterium]|uniref:EamA family transporter n=1 Tax=Eiseniibacteriota bacterium TaxID=2212470 RepID=A0A849SAV3_UNCEI|nr:EamA family transporter [Candidatus Eisenbacteria bacterium]
MIERTAPRIHTLLPALVCLLAAILFGASTPIAKALLTSVGPFTLAGLLYLGGALGVLPFAFRGGSPELRRDRRQHRMLALAVLFGGGLGPVLLLFGLRAAPAASVALWLNVETVATAIIAWGLFREHLDRRTVLAAAVVLAGGVLLAAPEGAAGWRAGTLVALACVCWGLDNNLTALVSGYTPAQTTVIKGIGAGTVNLAIGLSVEGHVPPLTSALIALVVGAFSYGFSIMFYISGAQQLGASRSQLLFSTSPFVGMLLAWFMFGESATIVQFGAAGLMVAGIALMLTSRHEHEHTHEVLSHTHEHRHDDGHHLHVHPGLPAWVRHTHAHAHDPLTHSHPHAPDLHHRHDH